MFALAILSPRAQNHPVAHCEQHVLRKASTLHGELRHGQKDTAGAGQYLERKNGAALEVVPWLWTLVASDRAESSVIVSECSSQRKIKIRT